MENDSTKKFFVCRQKNNNDSMWESFLWSGESDNYGYPSCQIKKRSNGKFVIIETNPDYYLEYVQNVSFESPENAGKFLVGLYERINSFLDKNPLPENVRCYLNAKAESLRKQESELCNDFFRIRRERFELMKIAKKHNIGEIIWKTESSDSELTLKNLLEFKIYFKKEGEEESEEVNFFSEKVLYQLIGKDDARSLLSLLRSVAKQISPRIAEELI